jgi:hypothetical protein
MSVIPPNGHYIRNLRAQDPWKADGHANVKISDDFWANPQAIGFSCILGANHMRESSDVLDIYVAIGLV